MARSGPIVIGDNNIVEERAEILNEGPEEAVMILGSGNLVGAGARVASLKMGNSNVVEAGARLPLLPAFFSPDRRYSIPWSFGGCSSSLVTEL